MTFLTMSNLQLALKSLLMTLNCILVIMKIKTDTPLMQSLNQFCTWSQTWQLSVAYTKCSVISFGSHGYERTSPYSLSGIPLQYASSIRDLGVCLNSDLTPSMHCTNIAAMAFNRSCLVLKSFHSNDVTLLVRLYKVYGRLLLCCNVVCISCNCTFMTNCTDRYTMHSMHGQRIAKLQ